MIPQIEMQDWCQLQTGLVFIYDGPVDPTNQRLTQHDLGQSAIYLRHGGVRVKTPKGEVTAHAGQWVFPKQGDRLQEFTPDSSVLSLRFLLRWPGGLALYEWDVAFVLNGDEAPLLEKEATELKVVVDRLIPGGGMHYRFSGGRFSTFLELQNQLYRWLQAYSCALEERGVTPSRIAHTDPRVVQIVQFLDHECYREPLRQKELAERVNLSSNQLNRLFVKHFQTTPAQYFEQRKVHEAMVRVQNSTDSFKEIAFDLGFNSPSHFSAWFIRKVHSSPRDYRAAHLEHLSRHSLSKVEG